MPKTKLLAKYRKQASKSEKENKTIIEGKQHYITVVGRWDNIFKLFPIENIDPYKVAFGMAVLASFGC